MKAVKAKYDNGGEIKYMYTDEEDGGKAHRAKSRAALKKKIDDLQRERKSDYSVVSGQSSYGKAYPKDRGLQAGGSAMKSTDKKSGLAGDIDAFYDEKIAKFTKELEKYREPPEQKVKMWKREDTIDLVKGLPPLAAQTKDSNIRRV